jgi:hypothetical protein
LYGEVLTIIVVTSLLFKGNYQVIDYQVIDYQVIDYQVIDLEHKIELG